MGAARRLGMCEAGHAIESSAMAGKCVSTLRRIDYAHPQNAHRHRLAHWASGRERRLRHSLSEKQVVR
jgi:hypothetical protein